MRTGWPPGLLQDDDRGLSKWFASKPDARRLVRERCTEIERDHMNQHTELTTDRELLELAAKAVGYVTTSRWNADRMEMTPPVIALVVHKGGELVSTGWDPLTDDGDALRLAVELGLSVEIHRDMTQPRPWLRVADRVGNWTYCGPRDYHGDELTQTRRTIVHAAAKIGKAMPCA